MTWSMGFKAPSFHDMLINYLEEFETSNQHKRYMDPRLEIQQNPGEITGLQLKQLKDWFVQQINEDDEIFARWAARFLSGHDADEKIPSDIELPDGNTIVVEPSPFVRFDFIKLNKQTYFYVAGEEFKVSLALAKNLTSKSQMTLSLASGQDKTTILKLLQKGFLIQVD